MRVSDILVNSVITRVHILLVFTSTIKEFILGKDMTVTRAINNSQAERVPKPTRRQSMKVSDINVTNVIIRQDGRKISKHINRGCTLYSSNK